MTKRTFESDDVMHLYGAIMEVASALRGTLDYCRSRDAIIKHRDEQWREEDKRYVLERSKLNMEREREWRAEDIQVMSDNNSKFLAVLLEMAARKIEGK